MLTTPNADKSTWQTVRFGDMVHHISERVQPDDVTVDRYVGLEHLDPESLKISRWGSPEEVGATKLRFYPGDIIFGKRRFYQRKLAVADFEGICSAHAMVLRAKPAVVLPEFLPFFMQSEPFFERAMSISVGSLSPTINWSTLQRQEFALPPLAAQRRIAEVLTAVENSIEAYRNARMKAEIAFNATNSRLMQHGKKGARVIEKYGILCPEAWQVKRLEEVANVNRGKFAHRPRNLPRFYNGPYPFVQTGDVAAANGLLTDYEQTLSEEGKEISRSFPPETILITIAAVIGKTAITTFEVWCPDSVVGIEPDTGLIDTHFLEFYIRTVQPKLENQTATQTAQKNINLSMLRPMPIPVPPKEEQYLISEMLRAFQKRVNDIKQHILSLEELKRKLIQKMLV